ncbi:adenosylcobinamide-GDP ribazoletransferase [Cognatishimia sp. F0-27]|nr:adenosylcobinamide-GDP ribazoletransferase [Cognatishimia sp. F0-27]
MEATSFGLAVQFLTRLPVPWTVPYSDELAMRAARYYPLVGALVGLVGALVLWLATLVFPPLVAVLLSLSATLLVTGAFHEDGLADTADGLGGGMDRAKALEIMRDSRIGSYGAIALVVVLGLKVATLAALPPVLAGIAMICAHGVSRMAAVHVIATTAYARTDAQKFATPKVTPDGYGWAAATAVVLVVGAFACAGAGALLAAAVGFAAMWIMRGALVRKLGGHTGDGLGAVQQLSELGLYLGFLAWL